MLFNFLIPHKLRYQRFDYLIILSIFLVGFIISISFFYHIKTTEQLLFNAEIEHHALIRQISTTKQSPVFIQQHSSLKAWKVLFTSLLITLLLTGYLFRRLYYLVMTKNLVKENQEISEKLSLSDNVLQNIPESVMITDTKLNIIYINKAFTQVTGYKEKDILGKKTSVLKSGYHNKEFYQKIWALMTKKGQWKGEIWNRKKDGSIYPEWLIITEIKNRQQNISHYAGIFSDISNQQHVIEHLQKLSYYDVLTGLPNRKLFQDRFNFCLSQAKNQNKPLALLFLDLDKFKKINDTLGHSAGDNLLNMVAERLKNCLGKHDIISRLGGDEFTIIMPDIKNKIEVHQLANKIIDSFLKFFLLNSRKVLINTSIGISLYPSNGCDQEILTQNADTAMYKAKDIHGSSYLFYKKYMNDHFLEHLELEDELYKSIKNQDFSLAYQPQIDLKTGKIYGAEALLRWQHATLGDIAPDVFIPLAEELGLIQELGEFALKTACLQTKKWLDQGYKDFIISVNLSGEQIIHGDPLKVVRDILKLSGLKPNQLELELTESILIKDIELSIHILSQFKALGIHLAIDDFGTGYSSLTYLKQFTIDKLKIDKSFIENITTDKKDASIANSIIALAHNLDLKVIAEGVETQAQLDFLKQQGCDQIQGYFYSRPLSAAGMSDFLDNYQNTLVGLANNRRVE